MICDFIYSVCTCWCMWVKKEYVKSALKDTYIHNYFTSLVNSLYLKWSIILFKVSIQCNHIIEIIASTNHNLLGRLCYTPCPLNNSFSRCLLEKLWGLYEPSAVTLCISPGTHIPYRCYKKCHWKRRWNFQMHQIYTVKQFANEEFLSNRYHAKQRTCAEEKLGKICARLETSPRKSLDSLAQQRVWLHRHQ